MASTDGTHDENATDPQPAPAPESYAWPLISIAVVVIAQLAIPGRYRVGPPLLVPLIEAFVFVMMATIAAKPGPVPHRARPLVITLCAILIGANTLAAGHLVVLVLDNTSDADGTALTADRLLIAGALVIVTNVVTFGLLYWQLDGGGPEGRIRRPAPYPDFQFPQTAIEGLAPPSWRPLFADHLYVAYTNVLALSPTDTMPLTRRAKGLMTLQSMISVGVLAVVLARVINILPS